MLGQKIARLRSRKSAREFARAILAEIEPYHPLDAHGPARKKRAEEAFHQRWRMISDVIKEYDAKNFCDLGCAEGYYVRRAATDHGIFAIGIDNDPKRLRCAMALSMLDGD